MIRNIIVFFALLMAANAHAEFVRFRAPSINTKLIANDINLTDWQTVMSCHFDYRGQRKQSIRYPQTIVKKLEGNTYGLKIKAGSLTELLPNFELLTCAYKIILIGKNQQTHQLAFGEIYLLGKESGEMSESELQSMQDLNQVTRLLNEKLKDFSISPGKDGGIVEEN